MPRPGTLLLALLLCCPAAVCVAPLTALAEAESRNAGSEEVKERTRALADRALELYQRGRYDLAIEAFQQADAEFHAPTLRLMLARCYAKLGMLADAAAAYEQTADEPLAADAPPAFYRAQREARDELAAIEPDVPQLVLTFRDTRDVGRALVRIDGTVLLKGRVTRPISLNPGEHRIEVTAPGAEPVVITRSFQRGRAEGIEVAPLVPAAPPEAASESAGLLASGIISLVVGVGGLVLGSATGLVALDKRSEVEERCPTKVCSPEIVALNDSADTYGTLSTIGFVAGGVGVVLGAVLIGVGATMGPSTDGQAAAAHATTLRVGLGLGTLELRGRF